MGKRIIAQRRGRGTSTYKAQSHRYLAEAFHRSLPEGEVARGVIKDIAHDPGRNAPLGLVQWEDGIVQPMIMSAGLMVGDEVLAGEKAEIRPGNTMLISQIPEGTAIFNVEGRPGDGGCFIRSSGGYGTVVSHDVDKTVVQLPSKRFKALNPRCKATIGVVAGGGRLDKPLGKAGIAHKKLRARGKLYPRTSADSMNAVDHKFGGTNKGVPYTRKRSAPPGAKVGSFGAKRTGKR